MSKSLTLQSTGAEVPEPAWIWGPAGRDVQLARAISDLTTGGYHGSTRTLLASIREPSDFDRRAYCSSVLSALIVRRHLRCSEQWLADDPKDPNAMLLHARVLVTHAIHARRADANDAARLASAAAQACHRAAATAPEDPTPWVALLCLGEAGSHLPDLERTRSAVDSLPACGPWNLFAEITRRHKENREGVHRLIQCCTASSSVSPWAPATAEDVNARAQVAVWAADNAPERSPLKLLCLMHASERDPFPSSAEEMRLRNFVAHNGEGDRHAYVKERTAAIEERWRRELRAGAVKLAEAWCDGGSSPPYMPLSDLSFLAYSLYRMGERGAARLVLERMIPHATASPWQRDGDPSAVLTAACLECNVAPRLMPR